MFLEYLCISLRVKLKDGGGPSNGSTRGRAASRSPNAADSPPTFGGLQSAEWKKKEEKVGQF